MENQNIDFRAVVKVLTKEGANAKEIHCRMAGVIVAQTYSTQWQSG